MADPLERLTATSAAMIQISMIRLLLKSAFIRYSATAFTTRKEVEMTKRETGCTVRGLQVWATAGLMLVLSSGLALAARINITNCTDTKVAICSYDKKMYSSSNQKRILDNLSNGPDTEHFKCKANCSFTMATHNTDTSCKKEEPYHWINHSWGSGDYLLVGVERGTDDDNFKSSNLVEGTTCP